MPKLTEQLLFAASAVVGVAGAVHLLWRQRQQRHHRGKKECRSKFEVPSELLSSGYDEELTLAVDLALQCGRNMYRYCDAKGTSAEELHSLEIDTKGQAEDFCTHIDIENERLVTEGIQTNFPTHKIIGEEATGTGEIPPLTSDPTWIIDPIDGTTNFAAGLPLACVSIGYCVEKKPVLGVVYAPMTDELYMAVKDCGAYRNKVRIVPAKSNSSSSSKNMLESLVCFEFGYVRDKEGISKMVGGLRRVLENGCRATRGIGSGVLDLCYVATGRIDLVYAGLAGEGWKPWDHCAGVVIAQEAGCCIESFDQKKGQDFDIYSKSIICGVSKSLVDELRQKVLS
jgi:fructose-1,6-bisphosphatase/inositol monophosphatase family enzyme